MAQTKRATFRCPLSIICSQVFPKENITPTGQPASFSMSHTSFHFRRPSTSGWRKPSTQPPRALLPMKRMGVGRSFPVRQRVTAWLIRALRRPSSAGHGSSKTLVGHSPTEERRHQLTILVIYSYLFKHFHLMFYYITFQIFISSQYFSGFH